MKQTAVQWLIDYLWNNHNIALSNNIIEQAKQMEKEQIIESYNEGALDTLQLGKEYYNFVYKP